MADKYLDGLARQFTDSWNQQRGGWGQFLDGNRSNAQVGSHGTAAGAIAIGASNAGTGPMVQSAAELLLNSASGEKGVQNLRLAWMLIGLSMLRGRLSNDQCQKTDEIKDQLIDRIPAGRLWGDYWASSDIHDPNGSLFTSAFILVALAISGGPINAKAESAALLLQESYLQDTDRYIDYEPLILVALFLTIPLKTLRKTVKDRALWNAFSRISFGKSTTYFYEFEKQRDNWDRDYLVLPMDLIFPLVLSRGAVWWPMQLRALATTARLRSQLDKTNLIYRFGGITRVSSLEQGLVALALSSESKVASTSKVTIVQTLWFSALKERSPWWDKVYSAGLVVVYVAVTSSALILNDIYFAKVATVSLAFLSGLSKLNSWMNKLAGKSS